MNHPLNLRSVDLNLLVFFDALMAERNVTRAANKVAISQSAMSNALSRLRHAFKDELFVRTVRGMEPTPRALELGPSVRAILQQTTRLMSSDLQFDAANSQRQFICRMSDLVGALVLPSLMAKLRRLAPGVSIEVLDISPEETVAALEADRLDIALSMHLRHKNTIRGDPLIADRMVFLVRKDHPLAEGPVTLKKFLAFSHLRVATSPTDIRFVESVLSDKGLKRNVALTVPHWLLVPQVLAETDLVAVISERVGEQFAPAAAVMRPLPFATQNSFWTMYWHRRYAHSGAHKWLREKISEIAKELYPEKSQRVR